MKKTIINKKAVLTLAVIFAAVFCLQAGVFATGASTEQNAATATDAISMRPDVVAAAEGKIPPPPPLPAAEGAVNGNDIGLDGGVGIINSWYADIIYTGSELELFAYTTTNYPCDITMTTVYLQWWNGSEWIDLNSYTDVKYYSFDCTVTVKSPCFSGNYYRVRSIHFADDGNTFEEYYFTNIYYVYVP